MNRPAIFITLLLFVSASGSLCEDFACESDQPEIESNQAGIESDQPEVYITGMVYNVVD